MTEPDPIPPSSYTVPLEELVQYCQSAPATPMIARQRINALAAMNLQWWSSHCGSDLSSHPYTIAKRLVAEALVTIKMWDFLKWAEGEERSFLEPSRPAMENLHQDLFQRLWTQYDIEKFKTDRIPRYLHRIDINDLGPMIKGKRCIDFGCGHGNFAHAMLQRGALNVLGLDFGEGSLRHAESLRDLLGVSSSQISFKHSTVYETGEPPNTYDFATQNGVFHHLDDENRAYREVHRVLKPGGWFWIYTVGAGAIVHTLYDASRRALADIPASFITEHLKSMNLSTGMFYQLSDSMIAVYRFATWQDLTARLAQIGFGNFRRCVGGFPGDFGHDVIANDKYGKEKYGEGDIRLVCQKLG
jgi:2-polyprenyl-3-methyl-5-hydroxy-6-metoxy-1,4-benzoquinol methylase